jgi:hypothetical protein
MDRCPWKIRYGTTEETSTQCDRPPHDGYRPEPDPQHEGPGLPQFPGQRVLWLAGDRREYTGDWPGYCPKVRGITTGPLGGGCTLPAGHHGRCAP